MGIEALIQALPISGIEANWLARLTFSIAGKDESITFLEPPAGQRVPFVDPVDAMAVLFRADAMAADEAHRRAVAELDLLRSELTLLERPRLYQSTEAMNFPECVPVPRLALFLKSRTELSARLIDFVEHAGDVTCKSRTYRWPGGNINRLDEMPKTPPPESMIEFFVGQQSDISNAISPQRLAPGKIFPSALLEWRESMKPVAKHLEQVLGEKVYHFMDLDDELDDDGCHRFLALHCWCSLLPESIFVQYLLEVTDMPDVETLKTALICPKSYTQPFIFHDPFFGIETQHVRFRYIDPGRTPKIGIAFQTEAARMSAAEIAMRQIGADVLLVAPQKLTSKKWIKKATLYCHDWCAGYSIEDPIAVLAEIDELYVISDENRESRGFYLKIGIEIQTLIWMAYQYCIPYYLCFPSGLMMGTFSAYDMKTREIQVRIIQAETRRREFTAQLGCLRVAAEYGSTGIWNELQENIPYDYIDLPFPLIRRIAAWQRDYDDTLIPLLPETADDEWWKKHEIEELNIAKAIQDAMGDKLDVQILLENGPASINSLK